MDSNFEIGNLCGCLASFFLSSAKKLICLLCVREKKYIKTSDYNFFLFNAKIQLIKKITT